MRILIFLMLSCFLFAQPKKPDTTGMPIEVKEATVQIVADNKQAEKATSELNKEMEKQLELMKQIKLKIAKLKNSPKADKVNKNATDVKQEASKNATKVDELYIEVDGQMVQWEPRPRTWMGRLFYSTDMLYYPFIVDQYGNKIYLK